MPTSKGGGKSLNFMFFSFNIVKHKIFPNYSNNITCLSD